MTIFRKKRKYRIKKKRVYAPTELEKERMRLVKRLYDEYGTLEKVGSLLKLTRERVRQILEKGERYRLFTYELTRDTKFKNILLKINKEQLTNQVRNTPNKFEICSNLDIDINTLFRLIKFYNIDIEGYRQDARFKRYLTEYSQMVNTLGYHPSTTVMQHSKEWRKIWAGIDRLWGGIDQFRSEFGIEKPKFSLHPNTLRAFHNAMEKRIAIKNIKIDKVYKIVEDNGPLSCRKIAELTGYSHQSVYGYIKNMVEENKIGKIVKGSLVKYNTKQL